MTVFRSASSSSWALRLLAVLAAVLLAACSAVAWVATAHALEERQSATAAADLRLSVLTLAAIESADNSEFLLARVESALQVLEGDNGAAVHALDETIRLEVAEAVDELIAHGNLLLAGVDSVPGHSLLDHESLEALLREAAVNSNVAAASNESRGKWAMAGVAFFLIVHCGAVAALRWAAQKASAERSSQRHAAERLETVLNETPDVTLIVADDGRITYHSTGAEDILGTDTFPTNVIDLIELSEPEFRDHLVAHLQTADASTPPITISMAQLLGDPTLDSSFQLWISDLRSDPLVDGRLITARDVTAEVHLRKELEERALQDALTGLPNRWSLINAMDSQVGPFTLLMIDLDGFKQTNDVLGHSAGDQLLIAVAQRFVAVLESDTELFRLGGDEFAVFLEGTDTPRATRIARELLASLTAAIRLDQGAESLRASIGVAASSPTETDPAAILKHADIAMYAAKAEGGNGVTVFEPAMERSAAERRDLALALESADIDTDFRLVFQPLVDAQSGEITHLEALIRWTSPQLGVVPPDVFISAAEASGKIVPIGQFVLERACRQLGELRSQGLGADVGMTVNISPRELDQPGFVELVLATIDRNAIAPSDLTIEVTETMLFRQVALGVAQLQALKAAGCRIAVDDFGSGYSNLGRLLQLPLDMIKVDRSLLLTLCDMRASEGGSPTAQCQVMHSIASIGAAIGAVTVAEGVETEAQWHSLRDSGVQVLQGFFFSKPVEAADVAAVVRDGVSSAAVPA